MGAVRARLADPRGEDGFMLIEVLITAMLVALIVVAILTGFDSVGRATADERYHDQAALLASESQEALRTDPSSALTALANEGGHTYTSKIGGETYTVTQTVEYVADSGETSACNISSGTVTSGVFARIVSRVSWAQLETAKRKSVSESSIITPPDGSGLEVDASNASQPVTPVEGVNLDVVEEKGSTSATTSKEGCAIFGAIPATAVTLEAYKQGMVTPASEYKVSKEVQITPNLTTHYPITLEEGGAIEAEFVYKGAREYEKVSVTGDTFVAYNGEMGVNPEFVVGSSKVTVGEAGTYEALPAANAASYTTVATTPTSTSFPTGNLFPFSNGWTVYAGDCQENRPPESVIEEEQTLNESQGGGRVSAGATTKVKVPMSYVNLSVYSGTSGTKLEETGEPKSKEPYAVKISNLGNTGTCKVTPNGSAKEQSSVHLQNVATSKENSFLAGHLIAPFQPFGKFKLCLFDKELKKTYTVSYTTSTNETLETIYLGAKAGTSGGVTVAEFKSSC